MRAFCWKASLSDSAGLELMQPIAQKLDRMGLVSVMFFLDHEHNHERRVKDGTKSICYTEVDLNQGCDGNARQRVAIRNTYDHGLGQTRAATAPTTRLKEQRKMPYRNKVPLSSFKSG